MCEKCPEAREQIGAKYGAVVVAMAIDPINNALQYTVSLGETIVEITMPVSASMQGPLECANFIGEHLSPIIASTSMAFMQREVGLDAENTISDIETMLRDQAKGQ